MSVPSSYFNTTSLPSGFVAFPLFPQPGPVPVQVMVVLRTPSPAAAPTLVLLRTLPLGFAYLAALMDQEGRVLDWLELWQQSVEGLAGEPGYRGELVTNAVADLRWKQDAASETRIQPEAVIACGFEGIHPLPTVIDLTRKAVIPVPLPPDSGAGQWKLCCDDAMLREAQLPEYSASLGRFLYLQGENPSSKPRFMQVAGDPVNKERSDVPHLLQFLSASPHLLPLNPEGGLMLLRKHLPWAVEDYIDLLGERTLDRIAAAGGESKIPLIQASTSEQVATLVSNSGYLSWHGHSRSARLLEVLHLKLCLFGDLVAAVQRSVHETKLPHLGICPEGFRVSFGGVGVGLPWLWTSKSSLVCPPRGLELPLDSGDLTYFVRAGRGFYSDFFPPGQDQGFEGVGQLLLSNPQEAGSGGLAFDGILRTMGKIPPLSSLDLIRIQLPVGNRRIGILGRLATEPAAARGEIRFRSVPRVFEESAFAMLKSLGTFGRVAFEVLPVVSTQCDLYALGVMGARIFLTQGLNESNGQLREVLDRLITLAHGLYDDARGAKESFDARLLKLVEEDLAAANPTHVTTLGPDRLVAAKEWECREAWRVVPVEIWADLIGLLGQLLVQSTRTDHALYDPAILTSPMIGHAFDEPLKRILSLARRTRTLLIQDGEFNAEVNSVIAGLLQ